MTDVSSLALIVVTALLNASGVIAIKRALNQCGPLPLVPLADVLRYVARFLRRPDALAGCLAFFAAPITFVIALRTVELVVAYPIFVGLNFSLLFGLAVTVLGEAWSLRKGLGMMLILAGVVVLQGAKV